MKRKLKYRRALPITGLLFGIGAAAACGAPVEGEEETDEAVFEVIDDSFGGWSAFANAPNSNFLASHASLMRTGKILAVAGSSYNCCKAWGTSDTRLIDIAANSWGNNIGAVYPNAPDSWTGVMRPADAFCSGHAHDDQGRVVFQGGLKGYGDHNGTGVVNSSAFNPSTGAFTQFTNTTRHWYPTLVAGVRSMFVFPGKATGNPFNAAEANVLRMAYGSSSWTDTGQVQATAETYPRVHLLPNGKMFVSSPQSTGTQNRIYDPITNTFTATGAGTDMVPNASTPGAIYRDWQGSATLLPLTPFALGYLNPTVAIFNDAQSFKKNLGAASPTWVSTGLRDSAFTRPHGNATLLPTGQVLVTGGSTSRRTEVYDPSVLQAADPTQTPAWLSTDAATVSRFYHSVALLLPDGRVWSGSSSINGAGSDCGPAMNGCDGTPNTSPNQSEVRAEIFTPWYVGLAGRPAISSCPAKISTDGSVFDIGVSGSQGSNIAKVALMRMGSVTHAFDTDQRHIWLDIASKTASVVRAKAPYGAAAAPPGDYMLFVLKDRGTSEGFKQFFPSQACVLTVEPQVVRTHVASASMAATVSSMLGGGYRPKWIDGYSVGTSVFFNVAFTKTTGSVSTSQAFNMTGAQFQTEFNARIAEGKRLTHFDSYMNGSTVNYAGVFEQDGGQEFTAYNDVTETDHFNRMNTLVSQGFRMINVSTVVVSGARRFTALYDKAFVGAWSPFWGILTGDVQGIITQQGIENKTLAYVNAFNEGGVGKVNMIFNGVDKGVLNSSVSITGTSLQTEYDNAMSRGQQFRHVAGFEVGGAARHVGVWSTK